jgi:hypothetical protein
MSILGYASYASLPIPPECFAGQPPSTNARSPGTGGDDPRHGESLRLCPTDLTAFDPFQDARIPFLTFVLTR